MAVLVRRAAAHRPGEIFRYTSGRRNDTQAERSIEGLFETFAQIESHATLSRPVPAAFGVDGYVCRYRHHFVYWRRLQNGSIGLVTILHERMHQIDRFRDDFGQEGGERAAALASRRRSL